MRMKNNAYMMWDNLEEISKKDQFKNFYKNVYSNKFLNIFFQNNIMLELQIFIHFKNIKKHYIEPKYFQ